MQTRTLTSGNRRNAPSVGNTIQRRICTNLIITHFARIAGNQCKKTKEEQKINKCLLIGRMTRNPEVSYTVNNLAVCRFTLAVDRPVKREGQPTADFIGCTAFGKTAETISKYLNKGSKIAIEGRWTTGDYTDKNGNKVYTNACTVERMEFVESKKNADAPAVNAPVTPAEPQYVPEGFSEVDDIPF